MRDRLLDLVFLVEVLLKGVDGGTASFLAAYLLIHGMVKDGVVGALVLRTRRVYPWAIALLPVFVGERQRLGEVGDVQWHALAQLPSTPVTSAPRSRSSAVRGPVRQSGPASWRTCRATASRPVQRPGMVRQ